MYTGQAGAAWGRVYVTHVILSSLHRCPFRACHRVVDSSQDKQEGNREVARRWKGGESAYQGRAGARFPRFVELSSLWNHEESCLR